MNTKYPFFIIAILSVALWRVIPHPPNVTPVMATALFCGCFFSDKKMAFLLPLLAMLIADIVIGFHSSMLFVYLGVAITVAAGIVLLKGQPAVKNVLLTTIACSLIFFILTNFGVWLVSGMYAKSLEGLLQAYIAGIPFYRNSIVGDVFFVALLFGGYYLASSQKFRVAS